MNLTIVSDDLTKALSLVGGSVASKPTLPVLSHVLLNASDDTLKLATTDLELWTFASATANVEADGGICVPYKLFADLVAKLPNGKQVTLDADGDTLVVRCGTLHPTVRGLDANEFPANPRVMKEDKPPIASFDSAELALHFSRTAYAAATDESRPILTGMLVESKEGTLHFVTADGFRLAVSTKVLEKQDSDPGSFILPARAASMLSKLLADETERVSLFMDQSGSQVWFRLRAASVVTQLLEGNYVNWRQIVPESYTTRIVVDRRELERAIGTAELFARHSGLTAHFSVDRQVVDPSSTAAWLKVHATGGSDIGEFDDQLKGIMDTDVPTEIAFNVKFLAQAVHACGTDLIALELNGSTRPGVVKAVGDDGYTAVLMPMHIRE